MVATVKSKAAPAASKNVPATQAQVQPPRAIGKAAAPNYMQKYQEDKGKGYSKAAEDRVVPFLDIVASTQNPQLNSKNEKYIKGAKVGDILIKGGINPIVDGEVGIDVQPCAFEKKWVEWVPRVKGGGFVGRYDTRPSDTVERPSPEDPTKTRFYRKSNGNEMIETRYHFVLMNGQPFAIAFKSTGHTISREWTNQMNILEDSAWAHKYHMTTRLRVRGQQEWYVFHISPVMDAHGEIAYVTEAEYLAGQAFSKSIESGMTRAADEEDRGGGEAGGEEI